MSEQDTFEALCREPFRKVMVRCFQRAGLGRDVLSQCEDIIRAAGWTYTDLNEELKKEMSKGNISLNISKVRDIEFQKHFLLTGRI